MALGHNDNARKLIPRWRSPASTVVLEMPTTPKGPLGPDAAASLAQKLEEWRAHPNPGTRGDLLSAAVVFGANDVVAEVRASDPPNSSTTEAIAQLLQIPDANDDAPIRRDERVLIRHARSHLALEPRDPLRWMELSRALTIVGSRHRASRAMRVALLQAPRCRIVLRSAARLAVHEGEPERARSILNNSGLLDRDPWLLATEISVTSLMEKTSTWMKRAQRLVESERFAPRDLSELAAALGTEERESGSTRNARKLFERALRDPTENVVAQAMWASRNGVNIAVPQETWAATRGRYEAESLSSYFGGDWRASLRATEQWFADEPFSRRPSIQASYVSAVALEEYAQSVEFARRGLIANPSDFTLRNNLAFALAHLGQLKEAEQHLLLASKVASSSLERVVVAATAGLLALRSGDIEGGSRAYEAAEAGAARDEFLTLSVRAFRALERLGVGQLVSTEELTGLLEALRKWRRPESRALYSRLARALRTWSLPFDDAM
ncbi:MAG: hypothetical protein IT460_11415 [Planctomycetes bacterium]|nr:hypothetical protein [Planctomycetota bacterium]